MEGSNNGMADFSELVKRFDKIRDYMHDFYVYGFKSRLDFTKKSPRTYDNERRRIESYLSGHMQWDYRNGAKISFVSLDCAQVLNNPLYAAWKSKSFTANDIMLHFFLLDSLCESPLTIEELTQEVCTRCELVLDSQTIRNKCDEYVRLGMLEKKKQGRAYVYRISTEPALLPQELINAVSFFQGAAPFGEIGSFILDNEKAANTVFSFKHYYLAHTLEDGILLELLTAIRQSRSVTFKNQSSKSEQIFAFEAIPLKIFVSATTGRRYACMYSPTSRRFFNYRLDAIKAVTLGEAADCAPQLREQLDKNLDMVWGVSFGGKARSDIIRMTLYINEKSEHYIIDRIAREGQGGSLTRLKKNTFLFTKEVFDSNDMSPWIKTFTGRIIALEGSNQAVVNRFYRDISALAQLYGIQAGEADS